MGCSVADGNEIEAFRLQPGFAVVAGGVAGSLQTAKRGLKRIPRQRGAFIRGPIPLAWLDGVLSLPGRVPLLVALALVYQSGLEGSATVRFTHKLMNRFGVAPRSASRALEQLQAAGLVRVHRPPGSCREIEILNPNCDGSDIACV
jgi:hypothetical protein